MNAIATAIYPLKVERQITSPITSKTKLYFSSLGFLERSIKYFGVGVALSVVSSKIMIPFMHAGMDWCPVFAKSFYTYPRNVCLIREYLPGLTDIYDTVAFKAPIVEELMFRFGLQEIFLKKLPKAILNRFAPSYASIIDTKIAKIARVGLTAIAFSLVHAMPPQMGPSNCSTARLVNTFVLGLILGGIQEVTGSSLMGILLHCGFNIQSAFLLSELNMKLNCPSA